MKICAWLKSMFRFAAGAFFVAIGVLLVFFDEDEDELQENSMSRALSENLGNLRFGGAICAACMGAAVAIAFIDLPAAIIIWSTGVLVQGSILLPIAPAKSGWQQVLGIRCIAAATLLVLALSWERACVVLGQASVCLLAGSLYLAVLSCNNYDPIKKFIRGRG